VTFTLGDALVLMTLIRSSSIYSVDLHFDRLAGQNNDPALCDSLFAPAWWKFLIVPKAATSVFSQHGGGYASSMWWRATHRHQDGPRDLSIGDHSDKLACRSATMADPLGAAQGPPSGCVRPHC